MQERNLNLTYLQARGSTMMELTDSEMRETGTLLSLLGSKQILDDNKELLDFSVTTTNKAQAMTPSFPLPRSVLPCAFDSTSEPNNP